MWFSYSETKEKVGGRESFSLFSCFFSMQKSFLGFFRTEWERKIEIYGLFITAQPERISTQVSKLMTKVLINWLCSSFCSNFGCGVDEEFIKKLLKALDGTLSLCCDWVKMIKVQEKCVVNFSEHNKNVFMWDARKQLSFQ